jgi:predicted nucleotidyltransferase
LNQTYRKSPVDAESLTTNIALQLQRVDGVLGVVLGGSRGRGVHTPTSDIDLGLYYDPAQPPDLDALRHLAATLDDTHRPDLVTPVGGWGPWINGGGWLTVHGLPVDFLYRDLTQVTAIIDRCCAGRVEIAYQPGHPHGFVTSIYMAEMAHCRILWDPTGALAALQARTRPYPTALRQATLDKFWWEVNFSLSVAHKGVARLDAAYVAGCCFRAVACLAQTLFALNHQYLMNEKGAIALAATFPLTLPNLPQRIDVAFAHIAAEPAGLEAAIVALEELALECGLLLATANVG